MDCPEDYYDIDVAKVSEVRRRRNVVGSWLLDLTADVLRRDRELASSMVEYQTLVRSLDGSRCCGSGVPAPVIGGAPLHALNAPSGAFTAKVLNGMRAMFGGHDVR